jgi:hypothetical protein
MLNKTWAGAMIVCAAIGSGRASVTVGTERSISATAHLSQDQIIAETKDLIDRLTAAQEKAIQTTTKTSEQGNRPEDLFKSRTGITVDSIPHPNRSDLQVYFFRPATARGPLPTIFFSHGIGAIHPDRYRLLIHYLVRQNVSVCYSNYTSSHAALAPRAAYTQLWQGFQAGHDTWKKYIDDQRIGFIGHSYGGGATPKIAWKAIHQKKWGSKACFIYIMAPWYCHGMTASRFESFPAHTILVTQVFEDDNINDYRIAADIFNSIRIPLERKCFITVFSAKKGESHIPALHTVPEISPEDHHLGRYVVLPVVDSLLLYAFNESETRQSQHSVRREQLRTSGTDDGWECVFYKGMSCALKKPQRKYLNFWGHGMNPRLTMTKHMPPLLRLCLQTPGTIIRYCAFGIDRIGDE